MIFVSLSQFIPTVEKTAKYPQRTSLATETGKNMENSPRKLPASPMPRGRSWFSDIRERVCWIDQDNTAYCQRCQKIKKKILETESAEPVYTAKNHKQGVLTEKEQKQIPETIQIFAVKKGSLLLKGVQKFSCIALYLHIAYSAGNDRDDGRQKNDVHNRQMVKEHGISHNDIFRFHGTDLARASKAARSQERTVEQPTLWCGGAFYFLHKTV